MRFTWDAAKAEANKRKHGLGFTEAKALFTSGADYLEIFDDTHSGREDRFIAIGPVRRGVVLVVWTERGEDVIRIISARWATPHEVQLYRQHMEDQR